MHPNYDSKNICQYLKTQIFLNKMFYNIEATFALDAPKYVTVWIVIQMLAFWHIKIHFGKNLWYRWAPYCTYMYWLLFLL